jgi:putative FmdB family regulatory protein
MPMYRFKCPTCSEIYELRGSFKEHDEMKKTKCPECEETLIQVYDADSGKVFIDARFGSTKKGFI